MCCEYVSIVAIPDLATYRSRIVHGSRCEKQHTVEVREHYRRDLRRQQSTATGSEAGRLR